MANELHAETTTGLTVYCVLLSGTGTVWNGSAFVALSGVTWTTADIAMTEAKAGIYLATMPTSTAGAYSYVAYSQAAGTPAVTDTQVGTGYIQWDGTAEIPLEPVPTTAEITAAVWAYVTRTLTMTAAQVAAIIDGTSITIHRGDTAAIALTGLGSLAGRTKLWFTVKKKSDDDDAESLVQVTEAGGLLYLNGAAATPAQGSLTVTDAVTGALTIVLAAAATATMECKGSHWDVQMLTAAGVATLAEGEFHVNADITRAVT